MTISKNKTRVLITIDTELKERAEEVAKKQDRSLSNYIVSLIREAVENQS